jgi:hypothetical protein
MALVPPHPNSMVQRGSDTGSATSTLLHHTSHFPTAPYAIAGSSASQQSMLGSMPPPTSPNSSTNQQLFSLPTRQSGSGWHGPHFDSIEGPRDLPSVSQQWSSVPFRSLQVEPQRNDWQQHPQCPNAVSSDQDLSARPQWPRQAPSAFSPLDPTCAIPGPGAFQQSSSNFMPPPFPPNSSTNQPSFSPPTWQSGGEGHECSSFGSGVGGRSQYPALMQDLGVPPGLGAPPGFPNAVPPRSGWQQPASLGMPSSDRSPGTPQWIGQGPSLPIVEPHEYPDPRFSSFHGRTYSVPLSPPRFDTTCPQGPSSLALSPSVISSPFESDAPMERGESAS